MEDNILAQYLTTKPMGSECVPGILGSIRVIDIKEGFKVIRLMDEEDTLGPSVRCMTVNGRMIRRMTKGHSLINLGVRFKAGYGNVVLVKESHSQVSTSYRV